MKINVLCGQIEKAKQEEGEEMEKFEKPFMRRSELLALGLSEELLDRAYRDKNQQFAVKVNPTRATSPIIYETEGLRKWLHYQIKIDKAVRT